MKSILCINFQKIPLYYQSNSYVLAPIIGQMFSMWEICGDKQANQYGKCHFSLKFFYDILQIYEQEHYHLEKLIQLQEKVTRLVGLFHNN
jgi:hypothetical protein